MFSCQGTHKRFISCLLCLHYTTLYNVCKWDFGTIYCTDLYMTCGRAWACTACTGVRGRAWACMCWYACRVVILKFTHKKRGSAKDRT